MYKSVLCWINVTTTSRGFSTNRPVLRGYCTKRHCHIRHSMLRVCGNHAVQCCRTSISTVKAITTTRYTVLLHLANCHIISVADMSVCLSVSLSVPLPIDWSNSTDHGRRPVINLGGPGPGHLSPSFNPPVFPFLSWTLQGVWAEPAAKHFDAIYTVKQLYKVHLVFNVLQKSACVQSSVTVGRNDAMDCRLCTAGPCQHGTKKWGVRAHLHPHSCRKLGGQDPRTPQDRRHCWGHVVPLSSGRLGARSRKKFEIDVCANTKNVGIFLMWTFVD